MGAKKLLDFQASISDIKQINPLFSTCKVRVLYTGKNRNMSIITKEAVEKALPTIKNIPIVGEFNEANQDYKGHGGAIDLDSYKYIHTTKPYGLVPESATYSWEDVKGADGAVRQYLTIDGCYLWTGRYEEAYSIVDNGKGQSMEIEVTDGRWDETEEAYRIDNFTFSALCILGDDVEPAFEDANIVAYSFDKDSFKKDYSLMMNELEQSLSEEKEDNVMLKELLKKYSITMEYLTEKGLKFEDFSEDELEDKIKELLELDKVEPEATEPIAEPTEPITEPIGQGNEPTEPTSVEPVTEPTEPISEPVTNEFELENKELKTQNEQLEVKNAELESELKELRQFKLNIEKANHEGEVQKMFSDFQLTEEDVKEIEIHNFTIEQIEDECYKILGRKMKSSSKNFSKDKDDNGIYIPIDIKTNNEPKDNGVYGDLFEQFGKN